MSVSNVIAAPPVAPPAWPEPVIDRARRWPVVLLVIACLVTAVAGVAVGAATGTSAAASTASTLAAAGDYARAIAIDEAISTRSGPFYLLDPGAAASGARAAEQTVMAWAAALGRDGKVDQAVALYRSVTTPTLRGQALDDLAALLLKASANDAAEADYPNAILRLDEIARLAPATPGDSRRRASCRSTRPARQGC